MTTTRKTVSINKKLSIFLAFLASLGSFLALPVLAAARPQLPADQARLQKAAENACRVALCAASNVQRRDLGGGIAEYSYVLRVGTGPYDAIGLHRVVHELAPFRPVHTNRALLLIAREAIRNAVAHAAPTSVSVRLSYPPGGIRLEIRDNGAGFEPPPGRLAAAGHFGILGMRERMEQIGGTLELVSHPRAGTTITAALPVKSITGAILPTPIFG